MVEVSVSSREGRFQNDPLDDQLIIYIHLLGFSEAIRDSDEARIEKMQTLLRNISLLRDGLYEVSVQFGAQEEEMVRPTVSTFAGLIVISYPAKRLRSMSKGMFRGLEAGLELAQLLVTKLAIEALKLGFLIRGGATVGPLYHHDGVVMGLALQDAYELESKISVYPRISISPHLYSQLETHSHFVDQDDDGVRHFKYIPSMILWSQDIEGVLLQLNKIVDENVEKFEQQGRLNQLAKWVWFRTIYTELRQQMLILRIKELAAKHPGD